MKLWKKLGVVAGVVATGAGISAASIAFATSTLAVGGAVTGVTIATSDFNDTSNSTTTFTDVPGMQASVTVPSGKAILDIRYSSESSCYGGGATSNWCSVQILVDGAPAQPANGCTDTLDYAYDSTDNGTTNFDNWHGEAMERYIVVGAGKHAVDVQGRVTDFGATGSQVFWSGERILVVDKAHWVSGGTCSAGTTTARAAHQGR